MVRPTLNVKDIARDVKYNYHPDMKVKDIEQVVMATLSVITDAIESGASIKLHKTMKIEPEIRPGYKAYAGLTDEYYDRPAKAVAKLIPLTYLQESLDKLAKKESE